ncbi:hypothetical protein AAFF_G00155820 [Aldrovandia affinis]|uniref:Uncharacterized protein n=1 Tax=Aldrovandia affinis TaxID=143900 RepID=A0AAD7RNE5_9TELE|nr:hypothetical protein AAFF_G00155820 [Aldrovandia affinis]
MSQVRLPQWRHTVLGYPQVACMVAQLHPQLRQRPLAMHHMGVPRLHLEHSMQGGKHLVPPMEGIVSPKVGPLGSSLL